MPCLKNAQTLIEAWVRCQAWTQRLLQALLLNVFVCVGLAYADNAVLVDDFQLQRSDQGIYLSTQLGFDLPPSLEDALTRGMPLGFVMQADVMRERWYWTDKLVSRTERYVRLSYQPLSKRWRVYVSAQPIQSTGLGVSLGQSYDSLTDALQSIQRVARWRVADNTAIDPSTKQRLEFRFRLDLSQLPQPLQFGSLGGGGWGLEYIHSLRLQEDSFK
jgi:hypothetical protein